MKLDNVGSQGMLVACIQWSVPSSYVRSWLLVNQETSDGVMGQVMMMKKCLGGGVTIGGRLANVCNLIILNLCFSIYEIEVMIASLQK